MIRKILVAYDGSHQSEKAFDYGLEMAARYSASLTVLSVARPPEPPAVVELMAALEHATDYYESHFAKLRKQAEDSNVSVGFEVRVGHPAEQIVSLADEWRIDAIVMGHRGESLLQKWLVGSVAKRVLSYAHCTIIIVR